MAPKMGKMAGKTAGKNGGKKERENNDNGTVHYKNVNNCLNTNIYSYLETSGDQSSNLYINVVHFSTPELN